MAEKHDMSAEHRTFSQCYDYELLPEPIQLEELSGDLRREIWNRMRRFLSVFREEKFIGEDTFRDEKIMGFVEYVLGKLFKLPQDEIQSDYENAMSQFKEIIEKAKFNKVLDLIEIVANSDSPDGVTVTGNTIVQNEYPMEFIIQRNEFILAISDQFNRHAAPYWLDISQRPCQFFRVAAESKAKRHSKPSRRSAKVAWKAHLRTCVKRPITSMRSNMQIRLSPVSKRLNLSLAESLRNQKHLVTH